MDIGIAPEPLDRAAAFFLDGDLAETERLCREVLKGHPGHARAWRQLGLLRLVSGDPAAALGLLLPLQIEFDRDPDLAIALAEAHWAIQGPAEAIPHYRRAIALAPDRVRARVRLGLALLSVGSPSEARIHLEQAATAQPDAQILTYLGTALLAEGHVADAILLLERATQLEPGEYASFFRLGQALRELGQIDEAIMALGEALARAPGQAHLHVALGDALFARGDHAAGKAELQQATAMDPSQPLAWAKLGDMEQLTSNPVASLECYQQAVALDGGNPELLALLGNALLTAGDHKAGTRELGRCMTANWHSAQRRTAVRVGILAAPGGANTPTGFIVDRTRFDVSPVFMLEEFDYPCEQIASSYDVMFNAVSDPDAAPQALALAIQWAPVIGLPTANPPAAIAGTVRERMAARLAGIEGLHVPQTIRFRRAELADSGVMFDQPMLIRPAGSHGGQYLSIARSPDEVRRAATALPCDEMYVTEFVDFRSPDGLYRKIRLVFVGGQPFPVHMAIGDDWLSHYFRTSMAEMPSWRAEEADFLGDHEAYLGKDLCRAMSEIQARIGLDFFGIDGAIGPDGRLVVFECNASMLVRHTDRPAMFDYKRKPAERIRTAVGDLLQNLARDS